MNSKKVKLLLIALLVSINLFLLPGCSYIVKYKYNQAINLASENDANGAIDAFSYVINNADRTNKEELELVMRSLWKRGNLYKQIESYDKSQDDYQDAFDLDNSEELKNITRTPTDLLQKGLFLMSKNDYSNAILFFDEALSSSDIMCKKELLFNEVICYEYLSDWNKAKEKISECYQIDPDDERIKNEYNFLKTR